MKEILGSMKTCSVCGKEFSMGEGWPFRRKQRDRTWTMCSYGCTRWWDERYRKKPVRDRRELMREAIREGKDNGQIMVMLGYSFEEIDRCRERMKREEEDERETESEVGGSPDR